VKPTKKSRHKYSSLSSSSTVQELSVNHLHIKFVIVLKVFISLVTFNLKVKVELVILRNVVIKMIFKPMGIKLFKHTYTYIFTFCWQANSDHTINSLKK
jgi:hypothetical protein